MNWSHWRRVRQTVQALAFALYLYLLFAALQRRAAFPLADLFFRLDPLGAFGAMLASRQWIPRLSLALVTLSLTLVIGRVWCGWLCPLGTLLEWVRFRSAQSKAVALSSRWRQVKNFLLVLIVVAALLGNLTLLTLDPLTLFTRTMTTAVLPALNHAVTGMERALYTRSALRPVVNWIERVLRGPVLPVIQPVYAHNTLMAAIFASILALNALADRFWCRFICPLGALLGLVSKVSLLRPIFGTACNRCGQCVEVCQVDAIDTRQAFEIVPSECIVCLDCLVACPQAGITFRKDLRPDPIREGELTRRQFLTGLATSAAGVVLLRTGVGAKQPDPHLIRPPGVLDEREFLALCLRCSQCMKVCPTSGLQPVASESGPEGVWTPQLVLRLGYCDYGCNACGQICPSGAIPPLDLAQKRQAVIGVAVIDRDRCLPWAQGVPCIVCEEMCPVPHKAIRVVSSSESGGESSLLLPFVLPNDCIGCGICEFRCPVEGESAIRVYR